jgi:hypothetical protein
MFVLVFVIVIDEPDPVAPCGIEKSRTAALDVPLLTTVTDDPGAPVVTVPTETVAAVPFEPAGPGHSWKSRMAALVVPELVTVIGPGYATCVTVPTLTVAASPGVPLFMMMSITWSLFAIVPDLLTNVVSYRTYPVKASATMTLYVYDTFESPFF